MLRVRSGLSTGFWVKSIWRFLLSLVQVEEEEELISEAGQLMRGGIRSRRGEKGGTGAQI